MQEPRPQSVRIPGHAGLALSGVFQQGKAPVRDTVVLSHCFTCTKDFKALSWLSRSLSGLGISVLRFDFAGLGNSQGDFRDTTLSTDVEDLIQVVGWLEQKGQPPRALIGHSMGGAASILAAAKLDAVQAVAVLGTSYRVGWRIRQLLRPGDLAIIEDIGEVAVSIGEKLYPITRHFLGDLDAHSLVDTVATWNKALLVVHGTNDTVVPLNDGHVLFGHARQPKSFVAVPDGDHLFSADQRRTFGLGRLIGEWLELFRGGRS